MAMTISEKILAAHAGKEFVEPGELIEVNVDFALANDITAPLAISVFRELAVTEVFDRERIALVPDHFVPNKDIPSALQAALIRDFAREQEIKHYFDLGETGVEHILLPEKGLVAPGDLIIGADSHTCTYGALGAFSAGVGSTDLGVIMATGKTWLKVPGSIKLVFEGRAGSWVEGKDLILCALSRLGVDGAVYRSLEFEGSALRALSMAGRFTMANMAVEAGAKNGIFRPDRITKEYMEGRGDREGTWWSSDEDALYEEVIHLDIEGLEPQVALPHSPDNVVPLSEAPGTRLDQVFIGSCTNGRIEDLRAAGKILKGGRAAQGTRLIVIPGTPGVYREALEEGLLDTFLSAGAVVGPPCCGPCLGGHLGILAEGERGLSTTNRNFRGRMGHVRSEVYLSNPAVAAASALLGRLGSPEEL